ncbi:Homeobox protein koza [Dissostichus eleginoides]|uniref:Homeobox protein koza n=1 Tax=Dissostichus eleginoides TaxID=100907 RepID=A0AAD9BZ65_DISEL|nr:Homeobox protein koza [Dissostichus eleginoides]
MEMSDTGKPLTSFLIEDILSLKDRTRSNSKHCSQKMDRCSQWREGAEKFSEQLSDQEFGEQTDCLDTSCPGTSESSPSSTGKQKRSRAAFTHLQVLELEKKFNQQKYLSAPERPTWPGESRGTGLRDELVRTSFITSFCKAYQYRPYLWDYSGPWGSTLW